MHLRSNRLQRDFELAPGPTVVGRLSGCDIVLASSSVSKRHLEIEREGERLRVRDLDSRNGSRVNEREIRGGGWVNLKSGDKLDVCGYDFRVIADGEKTSDSGSCLIRDADSGLSSSASRVISLVPEELSEGHQFSQLRALLSITQTLRDVLRTEEVLERAVDNLFQILPSIDRAAIGFFAEDRTFTPKWWQIRDGDPDSVIRISQTIVQHVAESSEAVITSDAMNDFEDARSVHALSMRSVMCAPLIDANEQVFGLIHVDSARPNMFSDLDLKVLAAVAMQISLAINFSRLHAIALEDAIVRRDIEQAEQVQQRFLPDEAPQIPGYELAGFYRAAHHIGGDYIDYIELDDGRLAIVLGDVVGKGVPAALMMVRLATETRASLERCKTPCEVATRLNQRFADDFVTMIVLTIDPNSGKAQLCNAGHEPPMLRRVDGTVDAVGFAESGYPLGVAEDSCYRETEIEFAAGDKLIFFSDGFPDAENAASGDRFGIDRIAEQLKLFDGSPENFITTLVEQIDDFVGSTHQFDDMCMICLRRTT